MARGKENTEWPGAFGVYQTAKSSTLLNIWTIVRLYLISGFLSLFLAGIFTRKQEWIAQLLDIFINIWISTAVTLTLLKSTTHHSILAVPALRASWSRYVDMFIVTVLTWLAYLVSLALLVVPFFFILPRLILAPYFVVDKNLGPIESLKASWHSTSGNIGKVYGILGANLVYVLLLFTIIGIPFGFYFIFMYSSSLAVLYHHLIGKPLTYLTKDV